MVKVYVRAIEAGKISINNVPDYWKAQVKAVFDEKLKNGEIVLEEYNRYISS